MTSNVERWATQLAGKTGERASQVVDELVAVGAEAARASLDDTVELRVEDGCILAARRLRVVDGTPGPGECALGAAREFETNAGVGDVVRAPIMLTWDRTEEAQRLEERLATHGAASKTRIFMPELADILDAAIAVRVRERLDDADPPREGTVRHTLRHAAWLRDVRVGFGTTTLGVVAAVYERALVSPLMDRANIGFRLAGVRDGQPFEREIIDERAVSAGDLLAAASGEGARVRFEERLRALCARIDEDAAQSTRDEVDALVSGLVLPPPVGSLGALVLTRRRDGVFARRAAHVGDVEVTFEVSDLVPPDAGAARLHGSADVVVLQADGATLHRESVFLGAVSSADLGIVVADGVAAFEESLPEKLIAWVAWHLQPRILRGELEDEAYGVVPTCAWFPALARAAREGRPPPPPPVTAWSDEDIARAAALVARAPVPAEPALVGVPFAAFTVGGWRIVLAADRDGSPHAVTALEISSPGSDERLPVMINDRWNPEARGVVDGGAWAFRRFCAWLAAAIVQAGIDDQVAFRFDGGDDDRDEEEEEEDEEEEDRHDGDDNDDDDGDDDRRPIVQVAVSTWLTLGEPFLPDEANVDWRVQLDAVAAEGSIEDFGATHGFTDETRARLRRAATAWRDFLVQVVDPRFAGARG